MPPGLFITGTDTGCGKTAVATALARALRDDGRRVRVLKPIETGCEERDGERVPLDALALAAAAEGTTRLRGAAELRVKESDRLAVMARGLETLGVSLREYPDGMDVAGGPIGGGCVDGGALFG